VTKRSVVNYITSVHENDTSAIIAWRPT